MAIQAGLVGSLQQSDYFTKTIFHKRNDLVLFILTTESSARHGPSTALSLRHETIVLSSRGDINV